MKRIGQRCGFDVVRKGSTLPALLAVCLMLLVSCGGGGGGGGGSSSTGSVSVSMTDAATTDYKAVYVTVARVDVCRGSTENDSCWQTVGTPNETYDLLTLVNGALEELGQTTLPSGQYSQVRLILGTTDDNTNNILGHPHPYANYFVDKDDNERELRVPSGYQTGIKIVRGFEIDPNQTTELVLDFDAARSIVKAGSSGHWNLKPTIKVLDTVLYSRIAGTVREGSVGESGVLVSAQVYSAAPTPGIVTVQAATVSDENGNYTLFLEPGTYTIVAYKDGFAPAYSTSKVVVTAGQLSSGNDFLLTTALMGTVSGSVSVSVEYATVSLRMTISGSEEIEVKSLMVTNDGGNTQFSTALPVGSYIAYFSTPGGATSTPQPFTIVSGDTTPLSPVTF